MIAKTSDYYRKLAETYDFDRMVKVDVSNEVIEIE